MAQSSINIVKEPLASLGYARQAQFCNRDSMANLGQEGVIQVVPPAALEQQLQQQATAKAAANTSAPPDISSLASYIKGQYEIFRNHRNTQSGWSNRLIEALRVFNGQYSPSKLAEIKKFGMSL